MVGEIHLAHIYFTDASSSKIRPVLLLKPNSFNDILYMPLTSNTKVEGFVIDNTHLIDGYLPKTSIVVYEKPGVIAANLIIRKIAVLEKSIYKQIINKFIQFVRE